MKSLFGFEDDAGRLTEAAFVDIDGRKHLVVRAECASYSEGEGDGFVLYDAREWNNAGAADHEADAEGNVTHLGRLTGQRLPASVMAAAIS